jgi:hypothetical protein
LHDIRRREVVDREAHAIHGDGAVPYHKVGEPRRESKIDQACIPVAAYASDARHAVDVTLYEVSAKAIADAQRTLEIHSATRLPRRERGARERRRHRGSAEPPTPALTDGEARTVDGDALALEEIVVAATDPKLTARGRVSDSLDSADVVDQAREHSTAPSA